MIRLQIDSRAAGNFEAKLSNRINFLGSDKVRKILQESGREYVKELERNINTFTPGRVPDLNAEYKKQKMKAVGFIYPILKRTGKFVRSFRTRVFGPSGGKPWTLRLEFMGTHDNGLKMSRLAEIHTQGLGRVPKRDFTRLPSQMRKRWFEKLSRAFFNVKGR